METFPFSIIRILLFLFIIGIPVIFIMRGRKQSENNESCTTKRFFSFDSIIDKTMRLLERFPITILLVIGFSVLWFILIDSNVNDIPYQLWVFFSVGMFLSASATLFAEDFSDKIKRYGIPIFVVLLWGVYCFFLPENDRDIHLSKGIEISVIGASAFFAMFFISFLRKNKNHAFWNFATQTLSQMITAVFFGAVLFGGLSLAIFAIDNLFNAQINSRVYGHLAVFCFSLFAPFYFLANIPDKANKFDNDVVYNKMQKIFALYILTPILAIYAVILYVYLIQIIIDWQLPRGMVSWLVTALAVGGLLVTMLLYPVREAEKSKVATFLGRWFGVIILPLLVLMTIGIFRRIGDHGITINRAYILLLNLWFYGIYIYLFFTHSRNIKWILISPIIIALIASTSVWSVTNFTERTLNNEIRSHFGNVQMPISEARILLSEMEETERERIGSVLEYMHQTFGRESVQIWFTDSVPSGVRRFTRGLGLQENVPDVTTTTHFRFDFDNRNKALSIPQGYNTFVRISARTRDIKEGETVSITVPYTFKNCTTLTGRTILIPMREVILEYLALSEAERDEREWIIRGNDYAIVITFFVGNYDEESDEIFLTHFSGNLFFNR